jgi:S1-C subfamily serine protease
MDKDKISFYTLLGLGAILTLAVVAVLAFAGGLALSPQLYAVAQAANGEAVFELAPATSAEPAWQSDDTLARFEAALIDIYQRALPSVVDIEVTQRVTIGMTNRLGQEDLFRRGEGSGFVWDQAGHIVTNYHVVEDAEAVKVSFADGTSAEAQVIGTDPDADLAVLEVDLPASEWQPLWTRLHYDQRYHQCRGTHYSQ